MTLNLDDYGKVDTATREYKIHSNEPPKINYVTVETASNPCDSEVCQNQNSLSTNVRFNVTDDLDPSMEDLEMCVSLSVDTCNSYKAIKSYTGFKNENNEFTFSDRGFPKLPLYYRLLPFLCILQDSRWLP